MSGDEKDLDQIIAALKAGERLEDPDLGGRDFSYQSLAGADLRGARLQKAAFLKADLSGADLSGADLSGAFFIGAILRKARLEGAIMRKADLYIADLTGAKLAGADLYRANLQRASLQGADLYRANLTEANLNDANLLQANLTEAQLYRATTGGALMDKDNKSAEGIYDYLTRLSNRLSGFYETTTDTALYAGVAVLCAFVAGVFGTLPAAMGGGYWIIPASIVIGAVIGVGVVAIFDRLSHRAAYALTSRQKMEETYSNMFYKRDIIHANYLLRQERYEEALEAFKNIYTKAPDRAEPRFKMARLYQMLNEPEKAIKNYEDIIDLFTATLGEDNMYIIESKRSLKELVG